MHLISNTPRTVHPITDVTGAGGLVVNVVEAGQDLDSAHPLRVLTNKRDEGCEPLLFLQPVNCGVGADRAGLFVWKWSLLFNKTKITGLKKSHEANEEKC